ncbi:MAG: hypothetical protein JRG91_03415 [Deltaproteobacteria bacterium]|nr:hypothetical protein [Deltaproteobacteria bacterium]
MEHPLSTDRLPGIVAKATDARLSSDRKLAVARGVMPMSSENLLLSLYQLCHDPDEGVARVARDTLQGLPAEMTKGALAKLDIPEPLDFFARQFSAQIARMELILLNKATIDETVERLARSCMKNVADLIANNQQRLLRHPAIIEALYLNKNTRMSTVDRVVTFAIRQGLVLEGIPAFKELAAAIGADVKQDRTEPPAAERRRQDSVYDNLSAMGSGSEEGEDSEPLEFMADQPISGGVVIDAIFDEFDGGFSASVSWDVLSEFDRDITGQEDVGEDEDNLSLNFQISSLSVPQKIRLALLGNAAHRALLVTDSNKLVAMAAVKSPTCTDQEIMRFATNRSVPEDVIRYIASRREWMRNYFVKVSLVNNPKTPLPTAMSLLTHLRKNDLRSMMRNKNVPTGLTAAARNIIKRQDQRKG